MTERLTERVARRIGDLDHPFYAEERQREVWNEGSAVGFQAMLWGTLALSAAMAWAGGPGTGPWAVGLLAVAGAASLLAVGYVNGRHVTGMEGGRILRVRTVLAIALYAAAVAGLVVRQFPGGDGFSGGFSTGLGLGCGAAVVGLLAALWRSRRSAARD